MEIKASIGKEAERIEKLVAKFQTIPHTAFQALMQAIATASLIVASDAVKQRFRGKGPFPVAENKLGVKSGRLYKSIRCTSPQLNLRTGEISVRFGSNVVYFAAHEFGFDGDVKVKGHKRRVNLRHGKLNKRASKQESAEVKPLSIVEIRPHNRRMKIPARRPLGTHLESPKVNAYFLKALKDGMTRAIKEMTQATK